LQEGRPENDSDSESFSERNRTVIGGGRNAMSAYI
jgi:hypothetical protein